MLTADFIKGLEQLPRYAQMLFCACLTQRMLPNYQLFAQATEFVPEHAIDKYLEFFWEHLAYPKSKINFDLQREQFEPFIPQVNDFDMYGVYPAIDCCVGLELLFSIAQSFEKQEASQMSRLSFESVTSFVQMQVGELDDEQLQQEILVERELAFQYQSYQFAQKFEREPDFIKDVKKIARDGDVSNLGICLRED